MKKIVFLMIVTSFKETAIVEIIFFKLNNYQNGQVN